MKKDEIRKLLLLSAAVLVSAAILFAVMRPIIQSEAGYSGFNSDVPQAGTTQMEDNRCEAYRTALPDETEGEREDEISAIADTATVAADTTANTIMRTLDDLRRESADKPAVKETVKRKPAAKKKNPQTGPAKADSAKQNTKRREFIGTEGRTEDRTKDSGGDIAACIHEDQKIRDGDRVRIRITEDCTLEGVKIPAGTIVAGTAKFSGNRIMVGIGYVKTVETDLTVFDNDCCEGIFYQETDAGKAVRGTGSNIVRAIASSIGTGSRIGGSIAEGGSGYVTQQLENSPVRLYGNYRITLRKR